AIALCHASVPSTTGIPPHGTSTRRSRMDQCSGMSFLSSQIASNMARGLSLADLPLYDSKTMPLVNGPQFRLRRSNRPYLVLSCPDHGGEAVTATVPDSRPSTRSVFHSVKQSTGRIASFPAIRAHDSEVSGVVP